MSKSSAKKLSKPPGSVQAFTAAAECLKTLAHPVRLRVVQLLLHGRYTVGELAQDCEQPGPAEAPTLRRKRGGRWWLRAAAIVLMLSGLGTVLTGGDEQPASCPVATDAIEQAVGKAVVAKPIADEPKLTELATVDTPAAVMLQLVEPVASVLPKVTRVGVFHNLSGAEQEAFLDFNEDTPSLGASVSF
jgi:hypothetical protein